MGTEFTSTVAWATDRLAKSTVQSLVACSCWKVDATTGSRVRMTLPSVPPVVLITGAHTSVQV